MVDLLTSEIIIRIIYALKSKISYNNKLAAVTMTI